MSKQAAPRELQSGGYDVPPRESYAVSMRVVDGEYIPNIVIDPFGLEWAECVRVDSEAYVGWLPTGRLVPSKITHEWGELTYER